MELRILFSALRRWRLQIVLATIAVALLAGLMASKSTSEFEARATLIVQPPASSVGGNINFADPDRYVDSQVTVLQSPQIAQAVIQRMGGKERVFDLQRRVRIIKAAKSDLVAVVAHANSSKLAIDTANEYVKAFIADSALRLDSAQAPEVAIIQDRLNKVGTELRTAEDKVFNDPSDSSARIDRDALTTQYAELVRAKTSYEFTNRARVNTQVAEFAAGTTESGKKSLAIFTIAGAILGFVLASSAAIGNSWLSPYISDPSQVEELTGYPVGAVLEASRRPPSSFQGFLNPVGGAKQRSTVKEVAIKVDNAVPLSTSFTIAVLGTVPGVGASALSASLAGFFGRAGAEVLLVDANPEDMALSESFQSFGGDQLPNAVHLLRSGQADEATVLARTMTTPIPESNVRLLGGAADLLNRFNIGDAVQLFRGAGDVLIFDCAPMTESAITASLCQIADVVVLLLPSRGTPRSTVETIVRQLGDKPTVTVISNIRGTMKRTPSAPGARVELNRPTALAPVMETQR